METLSEGERQAHLQSYYLADIMQEVVGDNCVSIRITDERMESR
jgi:hypothetical protein